MKLFMTESRSIPKLGLGKYMSIPKAGLIVFFRPDIFVDKFYKNLLSFIYTGDLDIIHKIVDVAGANHCSMFTAQQVTSCLNNSPYWTVDGKISSWLGRLANCYKPSEKGIEYYKKNLKKLKPIHKFNSGMNATLCNKCNTIIEKNHSIKLFCENCKL